MKAIRSLCSLALSLTCVSVLAVTMGDEFHRASLEQQERVSGLFRQGFRSDGTSRLVEKLFFDQKLDHSKTESETFKQRYFVDSTFAKDKNSPVFYIICGEWNCAGTGSYGYVEGLAKKMKAHLVALEHRYYGESLPMTSLTSSNLRYLNLQSAVDDLATFQKFMMDEKGLQGKWVAFGGSYAGTLAAVYRLKHPELVDGALASSAPVFMKNEFTEYDAHIAKVVDRTSCGNKVREAVKLLEERMKTPEGTTAAKVLFAASNIRDDRDFLYTVADMLAAAVQYGREKMFCHSLMSNPDPVAGYAEGGLKVLAAMGSDPVEISFQVAQKIETTPSDYMRQWMWQSCKEFGWFQVSNTKGATSRSGQVNLDYHEAVCQRLYGVSLPADGGLNDEWYFPLLNPETSGIIFTNGSNDPWLTLSILDETTPVNPMIDILMMDGANHCSDLKAFPVLPSVVFAQAEMAKTIQKWVQ